MRGGDLYRFAVREERDPDLDSRWKKNGWKTADRKPVKNAELWRELDALAAKHTVEWHWVKGHNGHPGNDRADALANRGVTSRMNSPDSQSTRRIG